MDTGTGRVDGLSLQGRSEAEPVMRRVVEPLIPLGVVDTDLRLAMTGAMRQSFARHPGEFDPREHEAIVNVPGTGRPEGEIVETGPLDDEAMRDARGAFSKDGVQFNENGADVELAARVATGAGDAGQESG